MMNKNHFFNLQGKTAIITGAATGLGAVSAKLMPRDLEASGLAEDEHTHAIRFLQNAKILLTSE